MKELFPLWVLRLDTRIKVIHQDNKGLSNARNTGVLASTGEWLTYIDSDDYVTSDYLETLSSIQKNSGADIVCANFGFFSEKDIIPKQQREDKTEKYYTGRDACKALLYEKDFYTSACNMLIRRNIAEKNPFPEGRFHEDEMTTFRYLLTAERVALTKKVLYYYFQRPGSIMHSFGQPVLDEIRAANYYLEYMEKGDDLRKAAESKKFSLIRNTIRDYPEIREVYPDIYLEYFKFLKAAAKRIVVDKNVSKSNRLYALKIMMGFLK